MRPSNESPRSFGLSVGGFCGVVALLNAWRGHTPWAIGFGSVGVVLVALALTAPALLSIPSRWWWKGARVLAWINTRILLTALFAIVFTPVAIVFRLFGRDSLVRQHRTGVSGWTPPPSRIARTTHYEHMY